VVNTPRTFPAAELEHQRRADVAKRGPGGRGYPVVCGEVPIRLYDGLLPSPLQR